MKNKTTGLKRLISYRVALCMIFYSFLLFFISCTPVHRFTHLKKIPREYRMNYCDDLTKSPRKFYWDRDPWVVFSDKTENYTFTRPGGKIVMKKVGFMDPFLVIGRKGEFLRVVKYTKETIKNGKFADRKTAEYCGWISLSDVLPFRNAVTDLRTGKHNKFLTAINDTLPLMKPENFFAHDSLLLFEDKDLNRQKGRLPLHQIAYRMKESPDSKKSLIASVPYLSLDSAAAEVLGWVSNSLIVSVGRQHYITLPDSLASPSVFKTRNGDTLHLSDNLKTEQSEPSSLKYQPVTAYSRKDSMMLVRTALFAPIIDYRDNYIFNVDGNPISYSNFQGIEKSLTKVNLAFVFEGEKQVIRQYPEIVNAIQNLHSRMEASKDSFSYTFSGVLGFGLSESKLSVINPSTDFMAFMDSLSRRISLESERIPVPAGRSWPTLRKAVRLFDNKEEETNLIILIGETGHQSEWADSVLTRQLAERNCRLLGFQLYGGEQNSYNNFVLQVENMIDSYAKIIAVKKRKILVSADQVKREISFKENAKNIYSLDFPVRSMTQGWIIFPQKKQKTDFNDLVNGIDTLLSQVREDNTHVTARLQEAFRNAGNYRSKYDSTLIAYYGIADNPIRQRTFADYFERQQPLWYLPSSVIRVPDSLDHNIGHHLLLNEAELQQLRYFLKKLSGFQLDYKWKGKSRPRAKKKCNCPDDELLWQDIAGKDTTIAERKYISSRRTRKKLVRFYLREANLNKVCKTKKRVLKKQTIAQVHEHILTCPTKSPFLNSFVMKELKRSKIISDEVLDGMLVSMKEKSEKIENSIQTLPRFTSNGQTYYWINENLLP